MLIHTGFVSLAVFVVDPLGQVSAVSQGGRVAILGPLQATIVALAPVEQLGVERKPAIWRIA